MRRSVLFAVAVPTAGLALAGCANGAAAHTSPQAKTSVAAKAAAPTLLHIVAKATGGAGVDNPPKGPSVGDQFFEHGKLSDSSGGALGTYQLITQLVAGTPERGDEQQSSTLHLTGGDVITVGDMPARDTYTVAVIGGTRSYAGTAGTLSARAVSDGVEQFTLTLEH